MSKPAVRVAFLDVAHGDTIVISVPQNQEAVIVDCIDAEAVLSYLEKSDIKHIRGVLITHLHWDHYRHVAQLLKNAETGHGYFCERVIFDQPRFKINSKEWQILGRDEDGLTDELTANQKRKTVLIELLTWVKANRQRYNSLAKQPQQTLPLQGIIELIHPWEVDRIGQTLNDSSGVLKVHGSGSSAVLTGDITPAGWRLLKQHHSNLRGDVLKFPHHGSWKEGKEKSSPDELLDTVNPSIVIMSVGTSSYTQYKLPDSHVFEALAKRPHIHLLCTQVTEQCSVTISEKRAQLIQTFKEQAEQTDNFFIEQNGCPCAGTVIVELSESTNLLQPTLQFHREHIIKPNFTQHQCVMD
jgi:competence protein ComEC